MFLQVSVCPHGGGHAWFFPGGCVWFFLGGACMVAPGGHAWFFLGGHAWLLPGGCMVFCGGACIGYDEIRSMSGRYASYWNAFLLWPKFSVNLCFSVWKCLKMLGTSRIMPPLIIVSDILHTVRRDAKKSQPPICSEPFQESKGQFTP